MMIKNKMMMPLTTLSIIKDLVRQLEYEIDIHTPNQKKKVNKILIHLWFKIYQKQADSIEVESLDHFVNISKKELSNFKITINKKRYQHQFFLRKLEEKDLIETNHKYAYKSDRTDKYLKTKNLDKAKPFTKSYRINTNHLSSSLQEIEIDFSIIYKNFKEMNHWIRKYPHLRSQIKDIYNTEIDIRRYHYYLMSNIGKELSPKMDKKGNTVKRILTEKRIFNYINQALKINFDNIWIKQSDEGRLYSSLTNLTSTALDFIKVDGEQVHGLDVSNCQPLLVATKIDKKENKDYVKDVEAGIFYDRLADELNIKREEAKLLSFRYIFFSNKDLKSGKMFDAINKIYPNLLESIKEIKGDKNLARILQSIESEIFINLGIKYSMLRHDAIYVPKHQVEKTKIILEHKFKELGLKVGVEVEV